MFDSRQPETSSEQERGAGGKGLSLPYRRYGGDISSPNLVEGTCLGASHTYHGTLCGHFRGGSRDEDNPGGEGLQKVGGGIASSQCQGKKSEEKMGGVNREKTEIIVNKISRIWWSRMPPELVFRKGSQRRKEERRLQRTPCEELLNEGWWGRITPLKMVFWTEILIIYILKITLLPHLKSLLQHNLPVKKESWKALVGNTHV